MAALTTAARWLRWFTTGTITAGLVLAAVPLLTGGATPGPVTPGHAADASRSWPTAKPGTNLVLVGSQQRSRRIRKYRVRPGDTPGSIAVRYHAWTDELVARNGSTLFVGEVIEIPVVRRAQRTCERHRHHHTNVGRSGGRRDKHGEHDKNGEHGTKDKQGNRRPGHDVRHRTGWHHADASRPKVRHTIAAKARRHGVDPNLALAIAWQESGWQQRQVSSAGALGAMQIMPGTGRWMSQVLGRGLNTRDLYHNASAGVGLIRLLRTEARPRIAVAGYYQGLAGVRRHGMYPSTKLYVADVLALKKRIAAGRHPR